MIVSDFLGKELIIILIILGRATTDSRKKYNIELLLLFSIHEIASFNTREQVCEEFHVRLGRGLNRIYLSA